MIVTWQCPWCGCGPQRINIENPERTGAQEMVLAHCEIEEGGCDTASAISVKISAQVDVHPIELTPYNGRARMARHMTEEDPQA